MDCREVRERWQQYYDSEGDPELFARMNDHLETCADCSRWFETQSRIEQQMNRALCGKGPSEKMWRQLTLTITSLDVKRRPTRRYLSSVLVAVAACAVFFLFVWHPWSSPTNDSLAKLSFTHHEQLQNGTRFVEFLSDSDLEVEAYLKKRAAFPVRCPPRRDAGFQVQGAGMLPMKFSPAAYLLGHVDQQSVSIIIFPAEALRSFQSAVSRLQQGRLVYGQSGSYRSVYAQIDRNIVVVVGEVPREKLERVLSAFGTYPHHS